MSRTPMFSSLQHRNARLFFFGLLVSNIGTWMQMTAMSLLVYELTGRAADVGITLFCQFLPMLLLGVWAGAVADRVDKRRMALLTQSLLAAQALTIGSLYLLDVVNLPVVYGLSLVLGVVGAFDNPARRGFVLELVEPHQITNAISLNTAVMTGSRVVGPALAAALKGPLGAGWLFMINGASFIAILWPLLAIDQSKLHRSPPARRGGTPVRDALRFIGHDRRLLVVFVVFTIVGTFAFNYSVSLLKIADVRFGREYLFGVLLAATGLGSMIGSLFTGARERITTYWFFGNGLLLGVFGLALAWSPNPVAAVVLAIPVGFGGAAFIAAQNAIVQQEAPPDMRGRLLALGAVAFLGTTPVGAPITGWIADNIGAEWNLAYGSCIALVAVTVGFTLRRRSVRAHVPDGTTPRHGSLKSPVDGVDAPPTVSIHE
ncbi:MAG: MFS transporter [Actinomycetota bacterium]|nr:MFS transporter [Actinomycetota bacterium]